MARKTSPHQEDARESDRDGPGRGKVRFETAESDQSGFAQRLRAVIGDEPVAQFARRAGFGESVLRSYFAGKRPTLEKLGAIAAAGDVTVDWLVTGAGVKHRQELRAMQEAHLLEADVEIEAATSDPSLRWFLASDEAGADRLRRSLRAFRDLPPLERRQALASILPGYINVARGPHVGDLQRRIDDLEARLRKHQEALEALRGALVRSKMPAPPPFAF